MELIADLHLHSRYSRAVSPQMVIPQIARWAKKKGIGLVAAPDWTHSLWLRELKENLIEVGEGVFAFKESLDGPKFILVTEISSIYAQGGKLRRIHNLVFAPSFAVAEKINSVLRARGANLMSDGRPIVGLTAKEVAELVFGVDKNCLVIPAHAWTPWFSLYGSKSGFDSLEDCFRELSGQILAIETGLSSDPLMNWRIGELDSRAIVSFSDAHSLAKIGREATVFAYSENEIPNFSYSDIAGAIKKEPNSKWGIAYTIEFHPEEGKYHYTGHRNCKVCHSPEETRRLGETCPVCGRPLTLGVMHRVERLATRELKEIKTETITIGKGGKGTKWSNRPPYIMLVPLMEILAEVLNVGVSSQSVQNEYNCLTQTYGSEFDVLLKTPLEEIIKTAGEKTGEGIKRVRQGDIVIDPGFDGVFGKVKIWPSGESAKKIGQMSFF